MNHRDLPQDTNALLAVIVERLDTLNTELREVKSELAKEAEGLGEINGSVRDLSAAKLDNDDRWRRHYEWLAIHEGTHRQMSEEDIRRDERWKLSAAIIAGIVTGAFLGAAILAALGEIGVLG